MGGEIVDTRQDPFATAKARRSRFLRLAFPFLISVVLVTAILAITLHTERVNRRDALQLTDEVVRAIETAVRREVDAYLAPTRAGLSVLAEVAAEGGVSGRGDADHLLERAMRRTLNRTPALASVFVGDADGDFVMVKRDGKALTTKLIGASGGPRDVRWIERFGGALTAERLDPTDDFDPASRPWFDSAAHSDTIVYSEVYRFFSTGRLGITVSIAVTDAPSLPTTVVGADLEIAELARFLESLRLGDAGRAAIVAEDGTLVAVRGSGSEAAGEVATVASLGDPVLAEAFDRFRIERAQLGLTAIDEARFLVSATSLADVVGRPWWLLLLVPEASFVGFVETNAESALLLSAAVVVIATLLGVVLTVQSLQSDARARRAYRSEQAVLTQCETLDALAALGNLHDPADEASLRRFAVVAAEATAARRVAVWWLDAAAARLVNVETFDREAQAHTAAAMLPAAHLAEAWPALTGGDGRTVERDHDDPAARVLRRLYLDGVGTARLDVVPVVVGNGVIGGLWFEDTDAAGSVIGASGLGRLMASLLAPRLERMDAGGVGATATRSVPPSVLPRPATDTIVDPTAGRCAHIALARDRDLVRRLAADGGVAGLGATLHPRIAVLQVRLGDALRLAAAEADGETAALTALVEDVRAAAEVQGIAYLKLTGEVVIAADGFNGADGDQRLDALADLALALQRACRLAGSRSGQRAAFRLGLDVGPAFTAAIGFDDVRLNLWGESCRLADRLAETAPPATIHISEAAYDVLGRDFLIRRRGSYFIDGVGETNTYLLAGRL